MYKKNLLRVLSLSVFFLATLTYVVSPDPSTFFTQSQTTTTYVNLKVSSSCVNGTATALLSWQNPNDAKSFTVFRNPNKLGALSWGQYATTTVTTYTDSAVSSGKTYTYQIRAVSPLGIEKYSSAVSIAILPCATISTPSSAGTFKPTMTSSCVNGTPHHTLSWSNPNQAVLFSLFRNPNALAVKSWGVIGTTTTTTFTDRSGKAGTTYQYQIQGKNSFGALRYSDILSVTTTSCATSSVTVPTISPTPTTTSPTTTSTSSLPTAPSAQKIYKWGVYSGWQEGDIRQFETIVGENPDLIGAFTHWGNANSFPNYMIPFAKDKGRTLVIFWEASNYLLTTTEQPDYSYDTILSGKWDPYIKKFAAEAKAYGGPVILIPFSEMNGNWSPWSGTKNGNTPEKAVRGYQHVRTVFGNVPNVKFGWAPNSASVPDTAANQIEKYYPGDQYVDYVGVDGFNFDNPWLTFDQVFRKSLTTVSAYKKPIYIFSFASAPGGAKAAWIKDALEVQLDKYPLIEGWQWFNQNKERNWLIWSDDASLEAFKAAVP